MSTKLPCFVYICYNIILWCMSFCFFERSKSRTADSRCHLSTPETPTSFSRPYPYHKVMPMKDGMSDISCCIGRQEGGCAMDVAMISTNALLYLKCYSGNITSCLSMIVYIGICRFFSTLTVKKRKIRRRM